MKKLFQNTAFLIGFSGVIIIFLTLNRVSTVTNQFSNEFSNVIIDKGFPFLAYREGISSNYSTYFFWKGLFANVAIALFFSFAIGLIFKIVWSEIASRRLR